MSLLQSPQMDEFNLLNYLSSQVDESIIKSTSGQLHPIWDALKLLSPQVDGFITQSTSGRVHPQNY